MTVTVKPAGGEIVVTSVKTNAGVIVTAVTPTPPKVDVVFEGPRGRDGRDGATFDIGALPPAP
jgi:hypothetical protein